MARTRRQRATVNAQRILTPVIPFADAQSIRAAAASAHFRSLTPMVAVWLATVAHIRHRYTAYESLLGDGYDRDSARFFVVDEINDKLTEWRSSRFLEPNEEDRIEDMLADTTQTP